ncbi:putative dehydrogenase [Okibacterium sp. HSC-33S16]|uniref:Gfo/Idh/MocA family protein n=1 Tax=Okibacterium sp. HSC-33S16 TaxID=2910965 RepID=UPI00209D92FD|nr:Gfo/Idh/MocA family oxidoreductase [Okibacterium sp. HSC-33S16]MCP2031041.1 putative dehydrogenase [Okibacterium sp. HSC-33S16]
MSFPVIGGNQPIRVVQVGAGGMGRNWIRVLTQSPDVELVGLVDLNVAAAETALEEAGLHGVIVGTNLTEVATASKAQAVVNVTIPAAHHPVNVEALFAGLPVLCEKPVAPTVAQGLALAAAAEVSGQLLMISQSRRYYRTLAAFRADLARLGEVGVVTTEFFKAPHFGGFREEMEHVLLVDMAIHQFDAVRYLLDRDPVSVYCEEFNPGWSWYSGDAAATAVFEFEGGTRYVYTGSWCADGLETSWNGSWRANAAGGSVRWDGEGDPVVERVAASDPSGTPGGSVTSDVDSGEAEEIAGALAEFVAALRTGVVPSGEVHSNVYSLAMVEAAVLSSSTGAKVRIADVLEAAYVDAVRTEARTDVRDALEQWGSPLG